MLFLTLQEEYTHARAQLDASAIEGLILAMSNEYTPDMQALETLYGMSKSAVYGFALSILKHPHDAEDVMQEAYIKVFYGAKEYRPQGKPMAWILTIVRNLALMKIRQKKGTSLSIDEVWELPDSYNLAKESIDRILLHAVFSVLTDEERQVVMLHAVAGMKHREIAEILDIPLSTVLSKYKRTLSKLKKQLEGGGQ